MEFNYEQVAKYIKGELPAAELQSFEQELASNTSLKEEVALYKDVEASLSTHFKFKEEDTAIEASLTKLSKKYTSENTKDVSKETSEFETKAISKDKPSITRRLFPLVTLAAAAALLLFIFNPFAGQLSLGELVTQSFKPYELETFMGDDESDKILKEGKKHYNDEAYKLALENFNEYLSVNPNDKEVQLAKGCSQFQLNQTDAAIQTFKQIENNSSAQWYLALSYLKKEEAHKAKTILESLVSDRQFRTKAKALLKHL